MNEVLEQALLGAVQYCAVRENEKVPAAVIATHAPFKMRRCCCCAVQRWRGRGLDSVMRAAREETDSTANSACFFPQAWTVGLSRKACLTPAPTAAKIAR